MTRLDSAGRETEPVKARARVTIAAMEGISPHLDSTSHLPQPGNSPMRRGFWRKHFTTILEKTEDARARPKAFTTRCLSPSYDVTSRLLSLHRTFLDVPCLQMYRLFVLLSALELRPPSRPLHGPPLYTRAARHHLEQPTSHAGLGKHTGRLRGAICSGRPARAPWYSGEKPAWWTCGAPASILEITDLLSCSRRRM